MRRMLAWLLVILTILCPISAFASEYTDKETVKAVQQGLNDKGYDCGIPDGIIGKNTKKAISSFQEEHALIVSGTIDDELLIALGLKEEPLNSSSLATLITSDSVSYSTNSLDKSKEGSSGIYAYKSIGGIYDIYFVIDFEGGYVYSFTEGNGNGICDRNKIESGNLNSVLMITYHDGEDMWSYGLHFEWKNQPDHLVVQDNDGFETDLYYTNLRDAVKIMDSKSVIDY